jgi:hypothetical protein
MGNWFTKKPGELTPEEKKKRGIFNLAAMMIIVAVCYGTCSIMKSENKANEQRAAKADSIKAAKSAATIKEYLDENGAWSYDSTVNEMDNQTTYHALLVSPDILAFKFPHDGGSQLQLDIRKNNTGSDVILSISKGQFLGAYTGSVRLKFDDEKPVTYNYQEPENGRSDLIFLNNANAIIKKIKASKKLMVECSFFDNGTYSATFDVAKLKWEH